MNAERAVRRSLASPRTRKTDWSRFDAMTDADVEAAAERDPDAAPLVDEDWFKNAQVSEPATKTAISIRIDKDVLDYFRSSSERYQTKINAVLRAYMEHEREKR